ncbi:sensor histidine kinase [Paraburkholderia caballeronis]|uniref:Sensor protein FixL n=1 Tax=Paraburkholderia caballeronis TaxID=416943 RepID=A0A1H7SUL1_9BURK|nr:PAS domain-containing sensor histidine kinase [Paraburkholderia caballeronis]PXW25627.1 PAS domain S-box-containing protein [Paraburkholderia caballeronis]PXX01234.1 PAS domain S-box-containing protein [Paraburkholderia caballeronis]RAJ99413.1 PAS domain S-box-containing protein [Paraburkholderia caballeronis]TDV07133.1 PAS domain S-box-containing protein [Paraburkholderia caballeronis]TDV11277.1 PAS domain S-box-containing protein [Paraburkholderia caballeronis]
MKEHLLEGQTLDWLLTSAAEAMLIVNGDGRIVLANPPVERLFGYTPAELIGQPLEILMPERIRAAHVGMRDRFFADPHSRPMGIGMELYACRRNGDEFPVEVSLSPLRTDRGLSLVMATIHDITPRKRAEEAVLESEARMRAIVDTAVDAIITIDERGTIERVNPRAEQLFGYSAAEMTGQNVSMLMPQPYREQHDGYLARYRETGEKRIIGVGREVVGLRKDGSTFPMDLAVAQMQIGARRMFTGVVRDITERRRAEEQRQRLMQEISAANEELTNFAYVVSHDLKAPLRGIGSLANWLSTDYADKFDDEGREHMRLLISRVHRMSALIDGILQYSRVGRIKEATVKVDLNVLLREVIDLLAPPPHVSVTVAHPLPTLVGERTRIQQVFQNLISNAIKYIDKPAGEVRIDCARDGNRWTFSVADNGIGIEPRHFDRIFQLFQTLVPRDRVESTGVGLTLVRKIVEMYGGEVWVESTPGAGSTFYFTFPVSHGMQSGQEAHA